jgi:hypothetical protein
MLTFRASSVVRPGTALANPYLAERLSDRSRLGPRVREVEIPGVSVAGVVLVGHGVLVGDCRPRSKTQPKEEGAARSRPLWS